MPSLLSISRPRQARSRSRATRSCAAHARAICASPIVCDSLVLSTISVSSRACTSLMPEHALYIARDEIHFQVDFRTFGEPTERGDSKRMRDQIDIGHLAANSVHGQAHSVHA